MKAGIVLSFAALLVSASAHAEPLHREAGVEVAFSVYDRFGESARPVLTRIHADIAVWDFLAIKFDWGLMSLTQDGERDVRPGNPSFAGLYRFSWGLAELRAGVGFSLPVARSNDSASFDTIAHSLALTGQQGLWRWYRSTAAILFPVDLELNFSWLQVRAFVNTAALIFTGEVDGRSEMVLDLGAQAALLLGGLQLGMLLQSSWIPTESGGIFGDDNLQVSAEPFARIELFDLLYGRVGFLMNLDRPFGHPGEDDQVWWALKLGVGAVF